MSLHPFGSRLEQMLRPRRQGLRARFGERAAPPPPVLSIFIASIASRLESFLTPLLRELDAQIGDRAEVEVLLLVDNQRMTIGENRNRQRSMAAGWRARQAHPGAASGSAEAQARLTTPGEAAVPSPSADER